MSKDDKELQALEAAADRTQSAIRLIWSLFLITMLLCSFALIGNMSKVDNDMAESFYCQSVHDGLQEDYNGSYKQGKCPQSLEQSQ